MPQSKTPVRDFFIGITVWTVIVIVFLNTCDLFNGDSEQTSGSDTSSSSLPRKGTFTGAKMGCISNDALNDLLRVARNENTEKFYALIFGGDCFVLSNRDWTIIKHGFEVSQVEVEFPTGPKHLFVPADFVR